MATRQAIREQIAKQIGDTAYANYTQDYLNGLINQAIAYGYPAIAQVVEDESITTEADTLEYDLPAACDHLVGEVYVEVESGVPYSLVRYWDEANGKLRFEREQEAGKKVRITYISPYPALSTDGETTQVSEDYIVAYAQREIWANKMSDPQRAGDMGLAAAMYDRFTGLTEQLKNERRSSRPMPRSRHIWSV